MHHPSEIVNEVPLTLEAIRARLSGHTADAGPTERAQRKAAVAMVLAPQADTQLAVLFVKRAENPADPWSGHMALPGGRLEPEDISLRHTAQRETLEEAGLLLDSRSFIGRLDDVGGGRLAAIDMAVAPHVYYLEEPGEVRLNYELADFVWVPLNYLADPSQVAPYTHPIFPPEMTFPSFQYNGYTIWGLTYRIVTDFMNHFGITLPREAPSIDYD